MRGGATRAAGRQPTTGVVDGVGVVVEVEVEVMVCRGMEGRIAAVRAGAGPPAEEGGGEGILVIGVRLRPRPTYGGVSAGRPAGGSEAHPMICPYCGADEDKVIDSRSAEAGEAIRRRRACARCGKRFTTYERVEKARRLTVVKRDGTREPFDPQRILAGIQAACGKRPIPEEAKLALVERLSDGVHRDFDTEIPSEEVGGRVARALRDLDPIVYIRFASEYYAYESLEEMNEEIRRLDDYVPEGRDQGSLFEKEGGSPEGSPTGRVTKPRRGGAS